VTVETTTPLTSTSQDAERDFDVESAQVRNASKISELQRTLSDSLLDVVAPFGSSCGESVAEFWSGGVGAPESIHAEARHRQWKGHRKLTLSADGSFILEQRNGKFDKGKWHREGGTITLDYEKWNCEQFSSVDNGVTFPLVWKGSPSIVYKNTRGLEGLSNFASESAPRPPPRKLKYVHGQKMPVSEDLHNEFKDVNYHAAVTLVPKYVTAFMNTGRGGTLFFGVHDTGVVSGMKFVKNGAKDEDHFRAEVSLQLRQRVFGYPIQDHEHYRLNFEPVLEDPATVTCVVELVVHPREQWPAPSQECKAWLVKAESHPGMFKYYRRDQSMVQQWPGEASLYYTETTARAIRESGEYADQPAVTSEKLQWQTGIVTEIDSAGQYAKIGYKKYDPLIVRSTVKHFDKLVVGEAIDYVCGKPGQGATPVLSLRQTSSAPSHTDVIQKVGAPTNPRVSWETGVVSRIDTDQKFAFIRWRPDGQPKNQDVYVNCKVRGFSTLLERGIKADVSFVVRTNQAGKHSAARLQFKPQAAPNWRTGVVGHIDKSQRFALIKSPAGKVYVHCKTPGFPTLVERGTNANVSFIAEPAQQGPKATLLRFEQQAIPANYWCEHADCHESVESFATEAALQQHIRDAHGYAGTTNAKTNETFEEKMRKLLFDQAQQPVLASKIPKLYTDMYEEQYKAVAPKPKLRSTFSPLPFCRIIDRQPDGDPTKPPVMYVQYVDATRDDPSLGRIPSARRRELASELTEQVKWELHAEVDPLDIEEDLDRTASALDDEARKALVLHNLKEEAFTQDCEDFEDEIDAGEHHLLDEQQQLLEVYLQNERLREELALDEEAELVKRALVLGQQDKELPAGTRLQYEGRGAGTVVGFTKHLWGANEHLVDFDDSPSDSGPEAVRLKFAGSDQPKAWTVISSGTSSPLAPLQGTGVAQPSWAAPTPREQVIRIWLEHGRNDKLTQLDELAAKAGGDEHLLENVRRKYLTP